MANTRFQGKRVSRQWCTVLEAAEADGVRFRLNSGRRTKAEQLALIREKGLYHPVYNPTGAAPYSPWAPHIRVGLASHALDIDSLDGGETRLERWIESQGVDWKNTVSGESWHGEISERDLRRLARKFNKRWEHYTPSEKRWIQEYDELKRLNRDIDRRRVLRRVMCAQAERVAAEARKSQSGWNRFNRRARYKSLKARCK